MNTKFTATVLVAAIIIVAAIGFVLSTKSNATTTSSSTTIALSTTSSLPPQSSTTIENTTITYSCFGLNSTALCQGGGPGKYYISADEAASLIGDNGTYLALYSPNGNDTQFSFYTNNVTASWYENYMISESYLTVLLFENVYKSPKAQYLYTVDSGEQLAYVMNKSNPDQQTIVAVNATLDGMTYSYIRSVGAASRASYLIGYKNGAEVDVTAPYEINQTALASVVANDLP